VVAAAGHSAFDVSALFYDLLRGGKDDPSLALALVREGDTVVDVGAGTGANTVALCLGVIHMLSPASRRTMLRNLHSCLCDDGLLVIDGVTPLGEAVHSLDVVLGRAHVGAHVTVGRLQTRQGPDGTWLTSVGYEITDEAGVTQSELVQYPSWPCRAQELGDDLRAGGFDVVDMSADEMSRIRSLDRPDVVVARVSGQSKRP